MTSIDLVQLADYAFLVLVVHEVLMRDTSGLVSDTGLAKIQAPVMIGSDSGLLPAKIVQGFILAYIGHKLLQEMGVLKKTPSMAIQKRVNRKRASRAMGCGMPSQSAAMEVVPGRVEPQSVIME